MTLQVQKRRSDRGQPGSSDVRPGSCSKGVSSVQIQVNIVREFREGCKEAIGRYGKIRRCRAASPGDMLAGKDAPDEQSGTAIRRF